MRTESVVVLCACLWLSGTGTLGAGVFQGGDTAGTDKVVLRVGGTMITSGEFADRLNLIPHPGQYRNGDDLKRALAASIAAEKILSDEAHRNHLDTIRDARAVIRQAEKEAVYEQWMNEEVEQKVAVSETALHDAYQRFRQQRVVDFVAFTDSASAASAFRAMQHGESLERAAAFENNGLVQRKVLEFAEALPAVEEAVYRLRPGQVSRIIKVDSKYYLFRLVSVQPHPRYSAGSFSYWRPALEKRVKARLIDRQFEKILPSLLREKSFEINRGVYEYVAGQMARRLPFQNKELMRTPELVNQEFAQIPDDIQDRMGEPFIHFSDGTIWTIGDVWSKLRYGPYLLNYQSEDEFKRGLKDVIRNMVVFETVVEQGYRKGLQSSPYVKKEARMWRDDLLSRLLQGTIEDTVHVGEEEAHAWYNAHPRDFLRPEMRKIQEIVVPDRGSAENLLDSVLNGADMTELARRYTTSGGGSVDSTGLHWIVKGTRGGVGQAAFTLKPGGLYGPIEIDSTHYAIIRLLEVQSEVPRPFAEVRDQIRLEVKRKKTYDVLYALLEKRVPNVPIAVDQDALSSVEVLEGNLMVRKSHFPNRFAVPLTTPFGADPRWYQKIFGTRPH